MRRRPPSGEGLTANTAKSAAKKGVANVVAVTAEVPPRPARRQHGRRHGRRRRRGGEAGGRRPDAPTIPPERFPSPSTGRRLLATTLNLATGGAARRHHLRRRLSEHRLPLLRARPSLLVHARLRDPASSGRSSPRASSSSSGSRSSSIPPSTRSVGHAHRRLRGAHDTRDLPKSFVSRFGGSFACCRSSRRPARDQQEKFQDRRSTVRPPQHGERGRGRRRPRTPSMCSAGTSRARRREGQVHKLFDGYYVRPEL